MINKNMTTTNPTFATLSSSGRKTPSNSATFEYTNPTDVAKYVRRYFPKVNKILPTLIDEDGNESYFGVNVADYGNLKDAIAYGACSMDPDDSRFSDDYVGSCTVENGYSLVLNRKKDENIEDSVEIIKRLAGL